MAKKFNIPTKEKKDLEAKLNPKPNSKIMVYNYISNQMDEVRTTKPSYMDEDDNIIVPCKWPNGDKGNAYWNDNQNYWELQEGSWY